MSKAERDAAQVAFLEAFAADANVSAACRTVGISRQTLYQWQEHDETFGMRYEQAEAEARDVIRAAVFEHAVNGWDEPVVSMGKLVFVKDENGAEKPLMQHKYDSALLAKLAQARLPEYREKSDVNITGSLDITGLAAEADQKFYSFLAASSAAGVLGKPDASAEG